MPLSVAAVRRERFVFARHTTYGLGGEARCAYFPKTLKQAVCVYDYLKSSGVDFFAMGCGSNLLVSDGGYNGAVIVTTRMKGVYRTARDKIFCRAGTTVGSLLQYCKTRGFSGLEYLASIPATFGGITCMNGGAAGKFIGDDITYVKFYDGKIRLISKENCKFGYKYSTMRDINGLILGAEVKITPETPAEVEEKISHYSALRSRQPRGRSCGCVFKNPPKCSAGKLIEAAGFKGFSIGGAKVSEAHANFIINDGGTAADVRALIKKIKTDIFSAFGVLLEEEVVYIGEFDDKTYG